MFFNHKTRRSTGKVCAISDSDRAYLQRMVAEGKAVHRRSPSDEDYIRAGEIFADRSVEDIEAEIEVARRAVEERRRHGGW